MATSPLPSRGPKRGRKCSVTPAFSRIPNAKRGGEIRSGIRVGSGGGKSEVAYGWAHHLQACIFSKIGNCFFAVRSCNFFIFAVNVRRKKALHRVIFFCGKSCNFFAVNVCNKKIVTSCIFFLR